jgi:hypothetical protein
LVEFFCSRSVSAEPGDIRATVGMTAALLSSTTTFEIMSIAVVAVLVVAGIAATLPESSPDPGPAPAAAGGGGARRAGRSGVQ